MPNIGERFPRPYQQAELMERDPAYGRIVCFCERVTRGEVRDALGSPDSAGGPRRPAPPDARAPGPLPGLLLRAELEELLAQERDRLERRRRTW